MPIVNVVVLVTLSFHPDATSAELIRQEDGWLVVFVRSDTRDIEFFTKDDVGGDIDNHALHNHANIVRYFESRLKAAGYEWATRRLRAMTGNVVAIWDLTPPAAA